MPPRQHVQLCTQQTDQLGYAFECLSWIVEAQESGLCRVRSREEEGNDIGYEKETHGREGGKVTDKVSRYSYDAWNMLTRNPTCSSQECHIS